MQICRGFTDKQWNNLLPKLRKCDGTLRNDDVEAWECAVKVFERRMRERFFSCVAVLETNDSKRDLEVSDENAAGCESLPTDIDAVVPGFAVMALACLLTETLSTFRRKPLTGGAGGTNDALREYLRRPAFKDAFKDDAVATSFANGVRNGILHEAETRQWAIWRVEPEGQMVSKEDGFYALNRTEFVTSLRVDFEQYLRELRDVANVELRQRFLKKMCDIVKEC